MRELPPRLFHGTRDSEIRRFDLARADEGAPFGPGTYFTADEYTAVGYAGLAGYVYRASVSGPSGRVAWLDEPLEAQPRVVREAVRSLYRACGRPVASVWDTCEAHLQALGSPWPGVGPRSPVSGGWSRAKINAWLSAAGLWMVCGTVHPSVSSGRLDQGIQYVVLDPRRITILGVRPAYPQPQPSADGPAP